MWGWSSPATWACMIVGLLLMAVFVRRRAANVESRCCACRSSATAAFAADNVVLGLMSIVFVPFFFFASVYAQVSLGRELLPRRRVPPLLLPRVRGRWLRSAAGSSTRRGARPAIVIGGAVGAVGFFLLAGKLTRPVARARSRRYIALAGGGLGLMLGPASTDAVNRAPSTSYSEVTGITQTVAKLRRQPRPGRPRSDPDRAATRRT